jgi:hypothetical protein
MGVKKMVSIKTIRRDRLLQRWQNYPNIALLLGVIVELEKGLGVSKITGSYTSPERYFLPLHYYQKRINNH